MQPNRNDITAKLRAIPALKGLSDETIATLSADVSFKRVDRGETLFNGGEPAEATYIVSFGAVKLSRYLPQGKEVVMCFLRAGDFIGAAVMTHANPRYPLSSVAMEDSGLIEVPRSVWLASWQPEAEIARAVNLNIMTRMMEFQDDKAMAVSSIPQKIAKFLLRTLDQQPPSFGNILSIKLSRKDVAERVGTTVETVIRTLSTWTQNGWIETHDQHIVIRDRNSLESILNRDS